MKLLRMIATTSSLSAALLAAGPASADTPTASAPDVLPLYVGQPLTGWSVGVGDFERGARLTGESAVVPKPEKPQVPQSEVSARRSQQALTLEWKDAWYAVLRLEGGGTLDLRPYLAQGTLEFDLHATDLAQAGLSFKLACGEGCERKINYLMPGRELQGKGWQHLSFALNCFHRDGDDFSRVTLPFAVETNGKGQLSIANVRVLKRGVPNATCVNYRTESVTPSPLMQAWALEWWMPRHEAKLAEVRRQRETGQPAEVVFIGDSITQGWEDAGAPLWRQYQQRYRALNLGFGGDHTENVLWRLQHGELDGTAPKVAVLMIGTNNTGDRQEDPRTTAAGIRRLLDEIRMRLPATRILLLAVFPRDPKPDTPLRRINNEINRLIEGYADGETVYFLDLTRVLMNADGTLSPDVMPDWLHLSEQGYRRWSQALDPTLNALVKGTTVPRHTTVPAAP